MTIRHEPKSLAELNPQQGALVSDTREKRITPAGMALAGLFAAAAIATGWFVLSDESGKAHTVPTEPYSGVLVIKAGTNVRSSPFVVESEGRTNKCATLDTATTIHPTRVTTRDDGNGVWYAFPLHEVPEPKRADCTDDNAKLEVWVANSTVQASS